MRSFWGTLALATVAATATAALIGLTGCTLYFNHDGDDTTTGDDEPPCADDAPAGAAIRLVNPETLACQSFYTNPCDGQCGPCTASAPYIPPWGSCESACIGKSETACAADPSCNVTKEANKYYGNGGLAPQNQHDDFLGCYPIGNAGVIDSVGCQTLDAEQCTNDNGCTAIYDAPYGTGCGGLKTVTPEQCPGAMFVACVREGLDDPGVCYASAPTCDATPPPCPANQTPAMENGCWTGACIPQQYCGLL